MERTDEKLYEKIKKKVYADIPKHSAYRSGILVAVQVNTGQIISSPFFIPANIYER